MKEPLFTEDQIVQMKTSYTMGDAPLASLAKEFGCSVPTIAKYLRRAGVAIRPRGRPVTANEAIVETETPTSSDFDNVFGE